jgi:tight adherence protein B
MVDAGSHPALTSRPLLAGVVAGSAALLALRLLMAGPPPVMRWTAPQVHRRGTIGAAALERFRAIVRRKGTDADAGLAMVLDALARAVRGGASLGQALAEVAAEAPLAWAGDLQRVTADLAAGASVREAMTAWEKTRPGSGARLAVTALVLAHERGGDLGSAADSAAASVRDAAAARSELAAQTVQARASAVVVAAAPVGFTALLTGTDGRVRAVVLGTPVGWVCTVLGGLLVGLGSWWIHRLVRDAQSWTGGP